MSRRIELHIAPGERQAFEGWETGTVSGVIADLKRLRGGRLFGYREAALIVNAHGAVTYPVKTGLLLKLLAPRRALIVDRVHRKAREVTWGWILSRFWSGRGARKRLRSAPARALAAPDNLSPRLDRYPPPAAPPVYLRTNLWFGADVGGSYTHANGVLNALARRYGGAHLMTTEPLPLLDSRVQIETFDLDLVEGWSGGAALHFAATDALVPQAVAFNQGRAPAFVYQRCTLGDLTGLRLARTLRRPLVLEYNGPETWVSRHWADTVLEHEEIFSAVEARMLAEADLVTVVSEALVEDAQARGVDPSRIVLLPNAVDPAVFTPTRDGAEIRKLLGAGNRTVFLLLSSFGPWHGAETLVEAYAQAGRQAPEIMASTMLVLAGDGDRRAAAEARVRDAGLSEAQVRFVGRIPYHEAPDYLAAADVLVSPQVPNPDGSEFFGSPTKVFEYMAMQKPMIVSALGQMGRILRDGETAILTDPGSAESLAAAILSVARTPQSFAHLGGAARAEVLRAHSWDHRIETLQHALQPYTKLAG